MTDYEYLCYTLRERIDERFAELPQFREKVSPKVFQDRVKFYNDVLELIKMIDQERQNEYKRGLDVGRKQQSYTPDKYYNREKYRAGHAINVLKKWEDHY